MFTPAQANRTPPNPIEHAMVLIDVCGSVESARAAADFNWEFASTTKDFMYWLRISTALTPAEGLCLLN